MPSLIRALLCLVLLVVVVTAISYLIFMYVKSRFSGYERLIKCLKNVRGNTDDFMNFGYWDETTNGLVAANRNLCDFIISKASFKNVASVLDVGCGYGAEALYLQPKIKKPIICLDISPQQIIHLREHIKELKLQNELKAYTGCATALPFPPESFDMIWSIESAFHYKTREDFFREAQRVLRPGGRLLIADIVTNPDCPRAASYFTEKICQSFFDVCDDNLVDKQEWKTQLERENFQVDVYDITDKTFKPYFQFFTTHLRQFEGWDRLLMPILYLINRYFSVCSPFRYVVAVATKYR